MIGFRLDIKSAKKLFFDRQAVASAVDRATVRVLSKFGSFVRRTAKRSIRKARQKKLSEMTPKERQLYRIRQAIGKKKGWKPKKPLIGSRPGEPHRWRTGLIRKFIFFTYEPSRRSVIIGPARIATKINVPELLEWGGVSPSGNAGRGVRIDPRPTMQLALTKEQPQLARLWKDAVR